MSREVFGYNTANEQIVQAAAYLEYWGEIGPGSLNGDDFGNAI